VEPRDRARIGLGQDEDVSTLDPERRRAQLDLRRDSSPET